MTLTVNVEEVSVGLRAAADAPASVVRGTSVALLRGSPVSRFRSIAGLNIARVVPRMARPVGSSTELIWGLKVAAASGTTSMPRVNFPLGMVKCDLLSVKEVVLTSFAVAMAPGRIAIMFPVPPVRSVRVSRDSGFSSTFLPRRGAFFDGFMRPSLAIFPGEKGPATPGRPADSP